jgi:hypothetical protein
LAAAHPAQDHVEFRRIAESAIDNADGRPDGAELRLSLGDSFRRVLAVFPVGRLEPPVGAGAADEVTGLASFIDGFVGVVAMFCG